MYTKASSPKIVEIKLGFDPAVNQDPIIFPCSRSTRRQKDIQDQALAVGIGINPVDWLADYLAEPPIGIPDFPLTEKEKADVLASNGSGPEIFTRPEYRAIVEATPTMDKSLAERVRAYFLDEAHLELVDYASCAKEGYYRKVLPSFPS